MQIKKDLKKLLNILIFYKYYLKIFFYNVRNKQIDNFYYN